MLCMMSIFSSTRGEKRFMTDFLYSQLKIEVWGMVLVSFIYCSWFFSNPLKCKKKKSHWIYYILLHKGRLVILEILGMWSKIVTEAKQMRVNHLHIIQYFLFPPHIANHLNCFYSSDELLFESNEMTTKKKNKSDLSESSMILTY